MTDGRVAAAELFTALQPPARWACRLIPCSGRGRSCELRRDDLHLAGACLLVGPDAVIHPGRRSVLYWHLITQQVKRNLDGLQLEHIQVLG